MEHIDERRVRIEGRATSMEGTDVRTGRAGEVHGRNVVT
jgi:hypothetical protein